MDILQSSKSTEHSISIELEASERIQFNKTVMAVTPKNKRSYRGITLDK